MMSFLSRQITFLVIIQALVMVPVSAWPESNVGVLISREIAPYVDMVEGLESTLNNLEVQRFFLDDNGKPYSLSGQGNVPDPEQFAAMVAVGPEAFLYLQPKVGSVPFVYGMVLNPDTLIKDSSLTPCGVALNLSIEEQLASIRYYLPGMNRLGILYDPKNNQQWYNQASVLAAAREMELVPLLVSRPSTQLEIVGDLTLPDAILFIPDKTIISRSVIQHVIKEAYLRKAPIIGYNRFFYESGAALSFVIDYNKLGRQVGDQVNGLLAGETCQGTISPNFTVLVNDDAWRFLALPRVIHEAVEGLGD